MPGRVFDLAVEGRYNLILSQELLAEVERVLFYPKFVPHLTRIKRTPNALLATIKATIEIVTAVPLSETVVRDPKDVAVLACAIGGKADYIVSGDKDLLVLNPFRGIPIVNPEAFFESLARE